MRVGLAVFVLAAPVLAVAPPAAAPAPPRLVAVERGSTGLDERTARAWHCARALDRPGGEQVAKQACGTGSTRVGFGRTKVYLPRYALCRHQDSNIYLCDQQGGT